MDKEKLKARIKKLFALGSNNTNEHEAQSALNMARKLLDKYSISKLDLADDDSVGITIESGVNMPWIRIINREVSRLYDVDYIIDKNERPNKHLFIGKEGNRITSSIVREYVKDKIRIESEGLGNAFRNSAAMGVKEQVHNIIRDRMTSQEEVIPGTGLVPVDLSRQNSIENDEFISRMIGEVTKSKSSSFASDSRGRSVGQNINLGAHLNGSRTAIGCV